AFAGMSGQKPATDADTAADGGKIGDKFNFLLRMFADARAPLSSEAVEGETLLASLSGQVSLDASALLAANEEMIAEVKTPAICLHGPEAGCDTDVDAAAEISPEVMAELTALMQNFPQLQTILSSKADLQTLVQAIDYLQMTKTPDLSKFNLPAEVKDLLLKLSGDQPALANLGEMLQKLQHNPDMLKAMHMVAEKLARPVVLAEAGVAVAAEAQEAVAKAEVVNAESVKPVAKQEIQNAKGENILAGERVVVESLNKTNRLDISKPMLNPSINAASEAARIDATQNVQSESSLKFEQTMNQALQASDSLAASKQSIMSAAGIDAYASRQATVPAHIASMQVAVQLQRHIQSRVNNFFIQLQPAELGRIEVTLKFEGKRVTAMIAAEKEDTLELLKHDANALQKALQGTGLESDSGSLEFSLSHGSNQSAEAKKNRHGDAFGTMIADKDLDTGIKQDLNAADIMMMASGRVDVKL
ncbi:MAG TPA: flagellar hook-length control protein FliK, partial [Alphaproteobacteria bacterium]|nr:flagellar hook-length control protein FliK [Alphaproteobacteria bacterium]